MSKLRQTLHCDYEVFSGRHVPVDVVVLPNGLRRW